MNSVRQVGIELPPLFEWQKEVMADTARYTMVLCARQIGKTWVSVIRSTETALRGGEVWWVAPNYDLTQAGTDLMDQIYQHPPFDKIVRLEKRRRTYWFRNGNRNGYIQIKSADNPRTLKSKALDLAVMDEFAEMAAAAWYEGVLNALSVRRGRALLIGNPPPIKNWSWDLFWMGDPNNPAKERDYQSYTYSQYANPLIDPAEIETKRRTMPHIQFLREVMGQLVDDGGVVFRGVRAAAQIEPGVDVLCQPQDGHEYVVGMDVAAGGKDFTVLIVFDVTAMAQVEMVRFTEPDIAALAARMRQVQEVWRPKFWELENNAAGMFLPSYLIERGFPIRPFNTNVKTKRELIDNYRAAVELGQVRLLRDATLIREHESMQMTTSASGLIQYSAPGKQHDDIVMASALAYRAATVDEALRLPSLVKLPYRGLYDPAYSRRYPGWNPAERLSDVRRAHERARR